MSTELPSTSQPAKGSASETYAPSYPLTSSISEPSNQPEETSYHHLHLPPDVVPTAKVQIGIGGTPEQPLFKVPVMGVGAWAWGDVESYGWGPSGGYDYKLDDESVSTAFDELLKIFPKLFIDVAEHYGHTGGYAEQSIGWNTDKRFTDAERDQKIVLASKFIPTGWRHPYTYPDIILTAVQGSLERTKMSHIDIYQLQGASYSGLWPRLQTLANGLARCYETGKIRAVGTCNLSLGDIRWLHDYFTKRNVPYVSHQIEFSLLHIDPWTDGTIDELHKLGLAVIGYTPLGMGVLTGKYSEHNLPKGERRMSHIPWARVNPIVEELIRIGESHGKTPGAVALNWIMGKGVIPIPSVKNAEQARDCAQSLGWKLSKQEEDSLNVLGVTMDWGVLGSIWNFFFNQAKYYPVVSWPKAPFARTPKTTSPFARDR